MSDRQIKVTVEHEPGCTTVVIIGILLGVMLAGKMGGCTINIGSEIKPADKKADHSFAHERGQTINRKNRRGEGQEP